MSREIKFRGIDIMTKQWVYGSLLTPNVIANPLLDVPQFDWSEDWFKDCLTKSIGQYTGLKDKNGQEIYEGDILRCPAKDDYEKKTFNAFEVFWHDNDCADRHVGWHMCRMHPQGHSGGGHHPYNMLPKYTKQLIVIGNIHENPELLST